MSDYLKQITAPDLNDPSFASQLEQAFQNIEDNFQRIVSAPYLQGQEGSSVVAVDEPIVETDGDTLTPFGRGVINCIFEDTKHVFFTLSEIDRIIPPVSYVADRGAKASDYLVKHPTMKCLYTYNTNADEIETPICGAEYYLYVDERIQDLNMNANNADQADFVDYTCIIFAQYVDNKWVFSKGTQVPTLYYNRSENRFCWRVNGIDTGIYAQGIKGEQGNPPVSAIVYGNVEKSDDNTTTIIVSEYWCMNALDNTYDWDSTLSNSGLSDGDLVVCLAKYPKDIYTLEDLVIGNIHIETETGTYSVTVPTDSRFSRVWGSYLLFNSMADINYKATDEKTTKALFVPAHNENTVHAIFQDDSHVNYSKVDGVWVVNDGTTTDDLVIKKVNKNQIIGGNSVGNANRLSEYTDDGSRNSAQTELKVVGYKVSGTVNNIDCVELGTPVGSIMHWIDMSQVPDGWFPVGPVNTLDPNPVFKLTEVNSDSNDYDLILNVGTSESHKFIFYDGNNIRDRRYAKIFCTLFNGSSAKDYIPVGHIEISTPDDTEITDAYDYMRNNWPFATNIEDKTINYWLTIQN